MSSTMTLHETEDNFNKDEDFFNQKPVNLLDFRKNRTFATHKRILAKEKRTFAEEKKEYPPSYIGARNSFNQY